MSRPRPHWLTPRFLLGTIAVLAGVWTLALYAGYGQSVTLGAWRISSRNPLRPLLASFRGGGRGVRAGERRARAQPDLSASVRGDRS